MSKPLMAKATAVWLVDNTALSFEQIGDFCKLHPLEVKGIADGEVAHSACVGFGMERIALALFRTHGLDPATWPVSVRAARSGSSRPGASAQAVRPRRASSGAISASLPRKSRYASSGSFEPPTPSSRSRKR